MLARVAAGSCISEAPAPPRPPAPAGPPETEAALVTTYPGLDPALLTTVVDLGSRSVVLEGAGPGNVPVDLLATIGELRDWGIPTVIASRARHASSRLEDLGPPDGLAAGVGAIGARGLPAHKARYALMAALGGAGWRSAVPGSRGSDNGPLGSVARVVLGTRSRSCWCCCCYDSSGSSERRERRVGP
ncbi:hypothetical protein FHX44_113007 [Pseudonocardia hierapolitana]|uniref:Asparaginase/glutaminase C-terminal domain-containing protein n=2 Tax=Pseudonocardia hierapolitana TaxID=1128676 RepID=A0A561SQH1_9PSEU|nr:hypothetical protein FHX44_113007 [Pseudonocardia hierapolitana]